MHPILNNFNGGSLLRGTVKHMRCKFIKSLQTRAWLNLDRNQLRHETFLFSCKTCVKAFSNCWILNENTPAKDCCFQIFITDILNSRAFFYRSVLIDNPTIGENFEMQVLQGKGHSQLNCIRFSLLQVFRDGMKLNLIYGVLIVFHHETVDFSLYVSSSEVHTAELYTVCLTSSFTAL